MTPKESKNFLTVLAGSALLWCIGALWVWAEDPAARTAFLRVFQWVLLDLAFLIFLFWRLFFAPVRGVLWKVQVAVSFTFKLVCIGFLAITLKELRNEPHLPAVAGILFLAVGPLVSATAVRAFRAIKDR